MVKLSSLHDDEGPVDVFYHWRRDTLVNALPMVVTSLIWGVVFLGWLLGGKIMRHFWGFSMVLKKDEDSVFDDDGSLSLPLLA